jgi:hypothetical protein
MIIDELNEDNFEEYSIANYRNPNCVSVLEFLDDLKKIRYIKRLINKYMDKGELRERLILNHMIFLSNVFGVECTVSMLRYKIPEEHHGALNAFFVYLRYYDEPVGHDLDLLNKIKTSI